MQCDLGSIICLGYTLLKSALL